MKNALVFVAGSFLLSMVPTGTHYSSKKTGWVPLGIRGGVGNMRKWLVVLVAALGLVSGVQAADGWGIYSSNKLLLFNGVGASYQAGITRFNLGASLVYVIPLGLQGGVSLVLPLGQQGASALVPYAGAGVEGDLLLIGNEAGFLVYPHGLLGLEFEDGRAIELRLGYLVFAGQSSAGAFAFGISARTPLY